MSEARVVVRVENLRKTYRNGPEETQVLRGVDLVVRAGELVSIVGPSGAGKTTLLYMMGGLARPSSGSVFLGTQSIFGLADNALSALRNQRVGFVFQSHHLLPELDAVSNVALPLRIAGFARDRAIERARQLLSEMGLAHRLGHRPGELSGGEQQRVAIARALANQPELVLADEPTGNLDKSNSEAVFQLLLESTRARGQAVIMVTHNPELAERTDRVIRMLDGTIQA